MMMQIPSSLAKLLIAEDHCPTLTVRCDRYERSEYPKNFDRICLKNEGQIPHNSEQKDKLIWHAFCKDFACFWEIRNACKNDLEKNSAFLKGSRT